MLNIDQSLHLHGGDDSLPLTRSGKIIKNHTVAHQLLSYLIYVRLNDYKNGVGTCASNWHQN
jgi:hypothetical protein